MAHGQFGHKKRDELSCNNARNPTLLNTVYTNLVDFEMQKVDQSIRGDSTNVNLLLTYTVRISGR